MRYFALAKNNLVVNVVVMPDEFERPLLDNLAGDWDEAYEFDTLDPIFIGDIYDPETGKFTTITDDPETPEIETTSKIKTFFRFFRFW